MNYAEIKWRKQMLQGRYIVCIGVAPIPVNDAKVMPVQCCVSASLCNRLNTQCDICTIHAQDKRAFDGREANTDMTQRGLVAGTHQPRSLPLAHWY